MELGIHQILAEFLAKLLHRVYNGIESLLPRVLADYKCYAMDVALNLAIELKLPLRCHVPSDR